MQTTPYWLDAIFRKMRQEVQNQTALPCPAASFGIELPIILTPMVGGSGQRLGGRPCHWGLGSRLCHGCTGARKTGAFQRDFCVAHVIAGMVWPAFHQRKPWLVQKNAANATNIQAAMTQADRRQF
jgi:hypothetical protein